MKILGFEITRLTEPEIKTEPEIMVRNFAAAKIDRLTSDWINNLNNINQDIKNQGINLISRSRDLSKNNAYYRKFLSMDKRNVIGSEGIRLQMKARDLSGNLDRVANQIIENEWAKWGELGTPTIDKRCSWIDCLYLMRRTLNIDGEFFVRKIRGKINKYNFALQFIATTAIDLEYNYEPLSGNRIIMGIELNKYGAAVAYYLKNNGSSLSDPYYDYTSKRIRIPAEEIIHVVSQEFIGQVRGFPAACGSMINFNQLAGYSEAELIAARIASCKMGFYTSKTGDVNPLANSKENGVPISDAAPGKFEVLPEGYDFKDFDPKHPQGNYPGFVKAQLREIANGMDISYNDFANDLEGVNFSSMRSGKLSENDHWKIEQKFTIEHFCRPVFRSWLEMFLITGLSPLPLAKESKFQADTWQPRTFPWVDPKKDAEYNEIMNRNGWKSDQEIIAETGQDMDDVHEQLKISNESKKTNGLIEVEQETENDNNNEIINENKTQEIKEMLDAYGIAVRAGAITPQTEDENAMREKLGLPKLSKQASKSWVEDEGYRRPITLKQKGEDMPIQGSPQVDESAKLNGVDSDEN